MKIGKALEKYKGIICSTCNIENLEDLNELEKDSVVGVAIILAFMKGVNSNLQDLSGHLGISYGDLSEPFYRLRDNGVFTSKYNIRNDKILKGVKQNIIQNKWVSPKHATELAWAHLAGISGGVTGLRNEEDKKKYG